MSGIIRVRATVSIEYDINPSAGGYTGTTAEELVAEERAIANDDGGYFISMLDSNADVGDVIVERIDGAA